MSDTDTEAAEVALTVAESVLPELQDVSARVKELVRRIDRLPAGTYELTFTKQDVRAMDWRVDVVRVERIESFSLSKYQPE